MVVHVPAMSSTMPTVTAVVTIDSDFRGVEIMDSASPKVATVPRNGTAAIDASSFTTTHSGTAQYLVAGLAPGTYDVLRGATPVLDDVVVTSASGTIYFESVSGVFTISQGAGVTFVIETTISLMELTEKAIKLTSRPAVVRRGPRGHKDLDVPDHEGLSRA